MKHVTINNAKYLFRIGVRDDIEIRRSYNQLVNAVFEFDFEFWYQAGYWTDANVPYVLIHNNQVVANVSVNHITFERGGALFETVQLGTICTDPKYRNQGLIRFLINQIFEAYNSDTTSFYLYANENVLEFYQQFGFSKIQEKQYRIKTEPSVSTFSKISKETLIQSEQYLKLLSEGNPYTAIAMKDNLGLLMFYLLGPFQDYLYYSSAYNVLAVYDVASGMLFDVFGTTKVSLDTIASELSNVQSLVLGFMPTATVNVSKNTINYDETALFVRNQNTIFDGESCVPYLSHA
ncbi:GNAT family N-acetyltransferase [Erysipelothrix anatis]|uniref:GNAT family N-acetyltransferase n=1 Tax=Erysipelothrix anatis TaxID=2683713 RepID=UPI001357F822|nr:GNAT family N-acetyltransferase [Erysipelothrix anatis]